jgi:hypothetical protein
MTHPKVSETADTVPNQPWTPHQPWSQRSTVPFLGRQRLGSLCCELLQRTHPARPQCGNCQEPEAVFASHSGKAQYCRCSSPGTGRVLLCIHIVSKHPHVTWRRYAGLYGTDVVTSCAQQKDMPCSQGFASSQCCCTSWLVCHLKKWKRAIGCRVFLSPRRASSKCLQWREGRTVGIYFADSFRATIFAHTRSCAAHGVIKPLGHFSDIV